MNRAEVVFAEKWAGMAAGNDNGPPEVAAEKLKCLGDAQAGIVPISFDETRLPHHVNFVRLNDEASLAAGAALVALEPWHECDCSTRSDVNLP